MPDSRDGDFLKQCLDKRLFDQALADRAGARARAEGRRVTAVLVELGVMAQHTVDAIEREIARSFEPRTIAGFTIMRKLGQGGMGTVYLAVQVSLQREVALKLIAPQVSADREVAERFVREARIAAAVNHPNIIGIIDAGDDHGQLFMALELITGGDASQLAERFNGVLPEARAVEIICDCCRGLQALYEARLIHRDIKPANIFITNDGVAKLADLGLARSENSDDRLTVSGFAVGTPAFMSPEQANGESLIDIRSDIYALGATLFALTTGSQPFTGNGPFAIAAKVITQPVPDPRALNPAISAATTAVILRAMAKRPDERYKTPNDLRAALEAAAATAALGTEPTSPSTRPIVPVPGSGTAVTMISPGPAHSVPRPAPRHSSAPRTSRAPTRASKPMRVSALTMVALVILVVGILWLSIQHDGHAHDRVVPTPAPPPIEVAHHAPPPMVPVLVPVPQVADHHLTDAAATPPPPPVVPALATPAPALEASTIPPPIVAAHPSQDPSGPPPVASAERVTVTAPVTPAPVTPAPESTPTTPRTPAPHTGKTTMPRPAWAATSGKDPYGQWADLHLGAETQRLRWIEPGSFVFGSPLHETGRSDFAEVQRPVTISHGFWMADSECTKEFYALIMGSAPGPHPSSVHLPADHLSYDDALHFCEKLASHTAHCLPRLPTRSEWEYAARAGMTTAFCFGADVLLAPHFINCKDFEPGHTIPVRSLQPNRWGLYDVEGNLCEWTSGAVGDMPSDQTIDPERVPDDKQKNFNLRGGSFSQPLLNCRVATGGYLPHDTHNDDLGFRFMIEQEPRKGP